jgi:DNA primase small subunit
MNHATLEFLKQRFSAYYQNGRILTPPDLEQREWGFIFFDARSEVRMRRHMAFTSAGEATDYIRSLVPAHVYYSTSYYLLPSAPTMNEKIWTGADLIFDLDADHIMRGPYREMLDRVKEEVFKLLAMLTDELGFSRRSIELVFSGGRGYHVHIRDIAVRGWGSPERRELVDYICGIGIDPEIMLRGREGPPSGWPDRYRGALTGYLAAVRAMGRTEGVAHLRAIEGVGGRAGKFYDRIDVLSAQIEDPGTALPLTDPVLKAIVSADDGEFRARLRETAALADEPVTTDIKRLIRLPGSLHGGSGLRVVPLTIAELESFDPLSDAVVFGEDAVAVEVAFDLSMPMLGSDYTLQKGFNRVPEALAVFLCCRGIAEIAGEVRDAT